MWFAYLNIVQKKIFEWLIRYRIYIQLRNLWKKLYKIRKNYKQKRLREKKLKNYFRTYFKRLTLKRIIVKKSEKKKFNESKESG